MGSCALAIGVERQYYKATIGEKGTKTATTAIDEEMSRVEQANRFRLFSAFGNSLVQTSLHPIPFLVGIAIIFV